LVTKKAVGRVDPAGAIAKVRLALASSRLLATKLERWKLWNPWAGMDENHHGDCSMGFPVFFDQH
jgi:hypothetical protein